MEAEPTLRQELAEFKKLTRYLVANTPDELTKAAFMAKQNSNQQRLKIVGIHGHHPMLRMQPIATEDEAKQITRAILACRTGANKSWMEKATETLEGRNQQDLWIKWEKLKFMAKPNWRKLMKWTPEAARVEEEAAPARGRSGNAPDANQRKASAKCESALTPDPTRPTEKCFPTDLIGPAGR